MTVAVGELLAVGSRSRVFRCGSGAVVKVPHDATPDVWIDQEAALATTARAAGAPVPRLLGIEWVGGRTASVWEQVSGPTLWQYGAAHPAGGPREQRLTDAGRLLAEVHLGLLALTPPVELPRQGDRLASKVRRAATRIDPRLRAVLSQVPESAGPQSFCHGDLHPGNVILSPTGPVVLDWFDACRGDRVAEIARTWLTTSPEGSTRPAHLPGATARVLDVMSRAYAAAVGVDPDCTDGAFDRWLRVQAVARLSEDVDAAPLLAVWRHRGAGRDGG